MRKSDALGVPGTTTIYGKSRSTAYDYALKYGYNFKDLSQAPAEPPIPGGDDFRFEDVEEGKWYTEAVKFVVNLGLMKGKSPTRFDLDSTTTRAEIVTILYRYDGEPSVSGGKGFSDVTADWAKASTKWASATKVVKGVGDNKFNPNGKISTQDFVVILYRYAESKGYDTGKLTSISKYSDAKQVSDYAQEPIQWAVATGILEPKNGKLNPKAQTSRAQAAVYLKNFCDFAG